MLAKYSSRNRLLLSAMGNVLLAFLFCFSLIQPANSSESSESGEAVDSCLCFDRLIHIIPNKLNIDEFSELLVEAKDAGFCTVVVGIRSGIFLDSLHIESTVPVLDRSYLIKMNEIADSLGLQIVPEIKLFTHQEHFLKQKLPDSMINLTTYDSEHPQIRELVESVILELVVLLNANAVHIGHDEVSGITQYSMKRFLAKDERVATAEEYLSSILHLNNYLSSIDVQTWMWGDMLIEAFEAPEMDSKSFHGHLHGYGRNIRELVPKNIRIFDWHYKNTTKSYSSINVFNRDGFSVVGVSYKGDLRDHAHYAATNGAVGMMSTFWDMGIKPNIIEFKKRIRKQGEILLQESRQVSSYSCY